MRGAAFVLAVLVALPAAALARAPGADELPTIEEMVKRAQKQIEADRKAREMAARDVKMEKIREYEEGKVSLYEVKAVVDLLKDDKEEAKYRFAAAAALRNRFKDLPANDDRLKRLKKGIGNDLINALNDGNDEVRAWVAGVFKTFWPGEYGRLGFDPADPYPKRAKAWREWKKFLQQR